MCCVFLASLESGGAATDGVADRSVWKEPHEEGRTVAMRVLQRYGKAALVGRAREAGGDMGDDAHERHVKPSECRPRVAGGATRLSEKEAPLGDTCPNQNCLSV